MNREQITARLTQLQAEMERASEEAGKLRPRLAYLEQVMQRLDGAMTVLQELLAEPANAPGAAVALGCEDRVPVAS